MYKYTLMLRISTAKYREDTKTSNRSELIKVCSFHKYKDKDTAIKEAIKHLRKELKDG